MKALTSVINIPLIPWPILNSVRHTSTPSYHPSSNELAAGVSTVKKMFGRKLKRCLDLLRPNRREDVQRKVENQINRYGRREKTLNVEETIIFKDHTNPKNYTWVGTSCKKTEASAFDIKNNDIQVCIRHSDQMGMSQNLPRSGLRKS